MKVSKCKVSLDVMGIEAPATTRVAASVSCLAQAAHVLKSWLSACRSGRRVISYLKKKNALLSLLKVCVESHV